MIIMDDEETGGKISKKTWAKIVKVFGRYCQKYKVRIHSASLPYKEDKDVHRKVDNQADRFSVWR